MISEHSAYRKEVGEAPLLYGREDGEPTVLPDAHHPFCACCGSPLMHFETWHKFFNTGFCGDPRCEQFVVVLCF